MAELVILRGLPASGKSTYAKEWVRADVENRSRVNRDELRETLHDGFQAANERIVTQAEHAMISALLASGRSVVVDNTNLRARYVRKYMEIAHNHGAEIQIRDFEVPITSAVNRDTGRHMAGGRFVGEEVIRGMADRFNIKEQGVLPEAPVLDDDVPTRNYEPILTNIQTILVDIDGTVAIHNGRSPYDYTKVGEDLPNSNIISLVHWLSNYYNIVFMSGRPETCRADTEHWLAEHFGSYDQLFMRPADKLEVNDAIIKVELFDKHVRDRYNVVAVFDDRNRVVRAWRNLGLTCLQVADGAF